MLSAVSESFSDSVHGGGRIGVLVAAEGATGDAVKEALTNIAMQIAAMNPQYISRNDIIYVCLVKMELEKVHL